MQIWMKFVRRNRICENYNRRRRKNALWVIKGIIMRGIKRVQIIEDSLRCRRIYIVIVEECKDQDKISIVRRGARQQKTHSLKRAIVNYRRAARVTRIGRCSAQLFRWCLIYKCGYISCLSLSRLVRWKLADFTTLRESFRCTRYITLCELIYIRMCTIPSNIYKRVFRIYIYLPSYSSFIALYAFPFILFFFYFFLLLYAKTRVSTGAAQS